MKKIIKFFGLPLLLAQIGSSSVAFADVLMGELTVLMEDNFDTGKSHLRYYLEPDQGLPIRLVGPKSEELPQLSEIKIQVEGDVNRSNSLEPVLEIKNFWIQGDLEKIKEERRRLNSNAITGPRSTVMYIVDLPINKASAISNYTNLSSIFNVFNSFYKSESLDQLSFVLDNKQVGKNDIYGPYLVSQYPENCSYYSSWTYAARQMAADRDGVIYNNYKHHIFALPRYSGIGCSWAGLAKVGCATTCDVWVAYPPHQMVYKHELGHNLGLMHAAIDPTDSGTITASNEYKDFSSPMGNDYSRSPGFNAPQTDQLGWYQNMNSTWKQSVSVGTNGSYSVAALNFDPRTVSIPQVIQIPRVITGGGNYYLSFRQAQGIDSSISSTYVPRLNIHTFSSTASGYSRYITSLGVGQSWNGTEFKVTLNSITTNPDTANFTITFNCVSQAPTITYPNQLSLQKGQITHQNLIVKNNNIACESPLTGTLTAGGSSSLTTTLPTASFSIPSGESVQIPVDVTGNLEGYFTGSLKLDYSTNGVLGSLTKNTQYIVSSSGTITNGMNYSYYKGTWSSLPNFSTLVPAFSGVVSTILLSPTTQSTSYGFNFTGYFYAPVEDDFTLYLSSDDGSALYLDGALVINNDGDHGTVELSTSLHLSAGFHPLNLRYYQSGGGANLNFSFSNSTQAKQMVPASMLFRDPVQ